MDLIYFIIWAIAAAVSILLIVAVFTIKDNAKKQTEILEGQTQLLENFNAMLEYQNEAMTTQIHLLASLAEKAGVPITDINEVTKPYDIEFVE